MTAVSIIKSKGFAIESTSGHIAYAVTFNRANEKRIYIRQKDREKLIDDSDIKITEIDGYIVGDVKKFFCPTIATANKKAKNIEKYSTKTELLTDKKDFKSTGARLRYAREELTGISQKQAYKLLGYAVQSELSKIENGVDCKELTGKRLIKFSELYDVSIPWILGVTDEWERNVKVMEEKTVNSWVMSQLESINTSQLNAMRVLHNEFTVIAKAANHAINSSLSIKSALNKVRELNPDFDDDIRSGATLVRLVEEYSELAGAIDHQMKRFNRIGDLANKTTGLNFDIFKVSGVEK